MKLELEFFEGTPNQEGWYLVELSHQMGYAAHRWCSAGVWFNLYTREVKRWAKLPEPPLGVESLIARGEL